MEINLKLKETRKFNHHYKFSIGSGHAKFAYRKDYLEQLKLIHDYLGIERVRFHGIFNDDMNVFNSLSDIFPLPYADKFYDIDFSRIGDIYDNILDTGMKPFVELGFMPKRLAKNENDHILFYYGGGSSMPRSDEEWTSFIRKFITYLIERYGIDEIREWFFEVWNEPDLFVFFSGSMEDYFHLYEITARAIKSVDKEIKVGGPSTSGSKWIREFVSFIEENDVPCDFITTHQYAGDPIGGVNAEEGGENPFSNPDLLKDKEGKTILDGLRHVFIDKSERDEIRNDSILINSKECRKDAKGLPLYYTEWNENATFSAYTNDTRKVPAFLIMTSLKLEENVTGSSVWCFSDIFEELHMFKEEFHGGFGLLTKHGIKKPSYYGMYFLSQLGEDRFIVDDEYEDIVLGAFKKDKEIELILTRQYMKNLDLDPKEIKIHIDGINPKAISYMMISETSGNPLKVYEGMENKDNLKKADIERIKKSSEVEEKELEYIEDNGVSFNLEMSCNDCALIRIKL